MREEEKIARTKRAPGNMMHGAVRRRAAQLVLDVFEGGKG